MEVMLDIIFWSGMTLLVRQTIEEWNREVELHRKQAIRLRSFYKGDAL